VVGHLEARTLTRRGQIKLRGSRATTARCLGSRIGLAESCWCQTIGASEFRSHRQWQGQVAGEAEPLNMFPGPISAKPLNMFR
jgi:hypothetical protein